jgi:hypothetical protein
MKKAMAFCIIINRYGGWTPAALAERLGMKLMATGDFGGWLTVDEVDEVRASGCSFKLTSFKFA